MQPNATMDSCSSPADDETSEELAYSCDDWYLPPEMWAEIFSKLTGEELLPIRLVCRRFRDIVNGWSLLRKTLFLRFPRGTELDGDYEPKFLLPAAKTRFEETQIYAMGSWWISFASGLKELHLVSCEVLFPTFIEMLRVMPKLKRLELHRVSFHGVIKHTPNFAIQGMETLSFTSLTDELVDVFVRVFPRLRQLLINDNGDDGDNGAIFHFVQLFQDTLESFRTWFNVSLLMEISRLSRLKLKKLTCYYGRVSDAQLIELSRLQPLIEDFYFHGTPATNKTLCKIGRNLKNLKHINIQITRSNNPIAVSFIKTMPKLESLTFFASNSYQPVIFSKCHNPNLKKVYLKAVHQTLSSWSFLKSFPNMLEITIQSCLFDSWSDLVKPINEQKSLQKLTFNNVRVRNELNLLFLQPWANLRSLSISHCEFSTHILEELLHQCLELRELHLHDVEKLQNRTVLKLCQELKYLSRLTIRDCQLTTKDAVLHAINHCHALAGAEIDGTVIR